MALRQSSARALLRSVTAAVLILGVGVARAAPWAEVGDDQLRSDVETLAMAGIIDDLTTHWPLPWTRILDRITLSDALVNQPAAVVAAAERLRARAAAEMTEDTNAFSAYIDGTNAPEIVRGFDALGRQNFQTQGTLSWNGASTFIQLSAGVQSHNALDSQTLLLDGTYIAKQVFGTALYAGYLTHWWGPGWISALSLSNNARPIPQIGISRLDTTPFKSRWLSWLGPWQAEFFVGVLRSDLLSGNTFIDGLHFNFNPAPGLEIGLERMDESCGHGHPCNPLNYFNFNNSVSHPSKTNDQGDIDLKYTHRLGGVELSAYLQLMNEDSNPVLHSATSHLAGLTAWVPVGQTRVRITAEVTDTIATTDIFSFGNYIYGSPYNDYKYLGGMRFRDRALGFSLDDDSKLETLQLSWLGPQQMTWTLTYHHANINAVVGDPGVNPGLNFLSATRVPMDIGQARVSFPLGAHFTVEVEARYSSNQLPPAHGSQGAGEVRLGYSL